MKRRIVITLLLLAAQAPAALPNDIATAIDPSDKNILYTGRWYRADTSAPWCSWQGCSIIAPFGGYGWRYYDANGVSRITGAADARDGDCYLRLENGANVHQPNPASDGDKFTVSLQMRGVTDSAKGTISIEFKDQKMWTDPLDTFVATKTLTTDWRQYSVTRTAPTGASKPVYQIKVIFQAGSGDVLDLDDVRMQKHSR